MNSTVRTHMCHRWVGGSHTVMRAPLRAAAAPLDVPLPPLRRYQALGPDGKVILILSYNMSVEQQNT